MWKSKLQYTFARNNSDTKYYPLLQVLDKEIEDNPKGVKMFLAEYIYKRRDS
jgi:hypothetical protein